MTQPQEIHAGTGILFLIKKTAMKGLVLRSPPFLICQFDNSPWWESVLACPRTEEAMDDEDLEDETPPNG
jgi:hypothetical protein